MKEVHYHTQPGDEPEKPPAEEEAREALTSLRGLAADAADRMEEILNNSEIPDNMKIAVINMVLERVYGKPEEMLRIESGERNSAEAAERLQVAIDLLIRTDKPMKDVATESGFGSVATFNRVFREKRGCTPTQFRAIYGMY